MFLVSIIFCLVAGSIAEVVEPGPCPNVTVATFDLVKYSGKWYQYAGTVNKYDCAQKCMTLYMSPPKKGVITVFTSSISANTGNLLRVESRMVINKNDLGLMAANSVPLLTRIDSRFFTLGNDPASYSVAWDCENRGSNHVKWIVLYTRDRNPSTCVLEQARAVIEKNGFALSDLRKYNHEYCDN